MISWRLESPLIVYFASIGFELANNRGFNDLALGSGMAPLR